MPLWNCGAVTDTAHLIGISIHMGRGQPVSYPFTNIEILLPIPILNFRCAVIRNQVSFAWWSAFWCNNSWTLENMFFWRTSLVNFFVNTIANYSSYFSCLLPQCKYCQLLRRQPKLYSILANYYLEHAYWLGCYVYCAPLLALPLPAPKSHRLP